MGAARAGVLECPHDVVVARVDASGAPLDPAGIVVNTVGTAVRPAIAGSLTFDGTHYVATFLSEPRV